MTSKKDDNNKPQDQNKKKTPKVKKQESQQQSVADHTVAARWVQEELLRQIPELGVVSESLIERILKLEHKYYIIKGYTAIRYADNAVDNTNV